MNYAEMIIIFNNISLYYHVIYNKLISYIEF